jgi:hypothetical protein
MVNDGGVREDAVGICHRIGSAAVRLWNDSILAFLIVSSHDRGFQLADALVSNDLLVGCNLCSRSSGLKGSCILIEPSKAFDEMATSGSEQ